jgi:hypothetical protein
MDNKGKGRDSGEAKEATGLDEPDPDWEPFGTRGSLRGVGSKGPATSEDTGPGQAGAEPGSDADVRAEPDEHGGGE